jgi:DNA-binding winged helix-turn-helix (wHTH) protein
MSSKRYDELAALAAALHSPAGTAETKNPAGRSRRVQDGALAVAVGAAAGSFRLHHRESGNRVLRFADFEIDVAQQELRRGGEVVHTEPQVFDLLLHLVRHRERIVSKNELIETIWNGRIVSEAALSSRIKAARKAIGDNGNDQMFIRTLHKRGFRFVGAASGAPSATTSGAAAPSRRSSAGRSPNTWRTRWATRCRRRTRCSPRTCR